MSVVAGAVKLTANKPAEKPVEVSQDKKEAPKKRKAKE